MDFIALIPVFSGISGPPVRSPGGLRTKRGGLWTGSRVGGGVSPGGMSNGAGANGSESGEWQNESGDGQVRVTKW